MIRLRHSYIINHTNTLLINNVHDKWAPLRLMCNKLDVVINPQILRFLLRRSKLTSHTWSLSVQFPTTVPSPAPPDPLHLPHNCSLIPPLTCPQLLFDPPSPAPQLLPDLPSPGSQLFPHPPSPAPQLLPKNPVLLHPLTHEAGVEGSRSPVRGCVLQRLRHGTRVTHQVHHLLEVSVSWRDCHLLEESLSWHDGHLLEVSESWHKGHAPRAPPVRGKCDMTRGSRTKCTTC